MLPDFFIAGVLKSGTTSLYEYVAQHPDVFLPEWKEPRFFDRDPDRPEPRPGQHPRGRRPVADRERYEALFEPAREGQLVGEGTASYFSDEEAPARIAAACPDARIVVVLREPVARAYSSFLHLRRDGREPYADFREALSQEHVRVQQGWEQLFHYVRAGRYATHLRRWYRHVPPERIQVHLFDDLVRDPHAVVADVFRHLGLDPSVPTDVEETYNLGGVVRSRRMHHLLNHPPAGFRRALRLVLPAHVRRRTYLELHRRNLDRSPPLDAALRRELAATFAPEIRDLEGLLDRDLSAWLPEDTTTTPAPDRSSR